MKLSEVLDGIQVIGWYGADVEIDGVFTDTRQVEKNSLFVCIEGQNTDSHTLWEDARARGAIAFICSRPLVGSFEQDDCVHSKKQQIFAEVVVEDTRAVLAKIAANFYGNPVENLKTVAVVGTNGKTTTSHIIREIIRSTGKKVCLIGTNGYCFGDKFTETGFTTPDPLHLQRILALAVMEECEYVVMEVSAHAIALKKTEGIIFDEGVFTNLSQDHLDFFKDMQTYGNVKKSFFSSRHIKHAIVNTDDELGRKIVLATDVGVVTYGLANPADVFAIDYTPTGAKTSFVINANDEIYDVVTPFLGRYNLENTLAAIACCVSLSMMLDSCVQALKNMKKVSGRYQTFKMNDFTVVIDYAHTPDGIKNILQSIREWAKGRVHCVFGCGGNRDALKRPIMGKIVHEMADVMWVTSDNPRNELPERIIDDILSGLDANDLKELDKLNEKKIFRISDRRDCIKECVKSAKAGDVVAILGKGNESYLECLGEKIHYMDEEVIKELGAC